MYEYQQQNLSNVGIWQPLRMSNDEYGNWHDLNTNGTQQRNSLESFEASIDQEVLPGLNLNAAVLHEISNYGELNLGRVDFVADQIDVNQTLPWGAANPNFGDTEMYFCLLYTSCPWGHARGSCPHALWRRGGAFCGARRADSRLRGTPQRRARPRV